MDFVGTLCIKVAYEQAEDICFFFTCTATCAVHLELTRDVGVDTFLLALCQFVSHRGLPATITCISDTFRSTSKQVSKIIGSSETQKFLTKKLYVIEIHYRKGLLVGWILIQSVKHCLRKSLGQTILNFDQIKSLKTAIHLC